MLLQDFTREALTTYFHVNNLTFIFIDAHKTGLGAILVQGENISNAKAIIMISRSTKKVEQNYVQLDLEATTVDYALFCFCLYLIGSSHKNVIVTDY